MTIEIQLLTIGLTLLAVAYMLLSRSLRLQQDLNEALSKTLFDLYAQHEWLDLRVLELEEKAGSNTEVQVTPKLYLDPDQAAALASSKAFHKAVQRIITKGGAQ